jgi:hypothetical protein
MAEYDEIRSSSEHASYIELGRVSGILLRKEFREHLERNSKLSWELIGDYSTGDFWKAYENCQTFETINSAILNGNGYRLKYGKENMKRFRDIQHVHLTKDAKDAKDRRLKSAVNKAFYMAKKRIFPHIFRKVPNSHQNIAIILSIKANWPTFDIDRYLNRQEKDVPIPILEAMESTWHLNALEFPQFMKLQRDWLSWTTQEKKLSYEKDPLLLWNVEEYRKDIYGWHVHRDIIWPQFVKDFQPQTQSTCVPGL